MNYYEARQINEGTEKGKWHFTCQNDGRIWPVGYCRDHPGHDTAEQAQECFRRYLLDEITEREFDDWTGCRVCDAPTKKGLSIRQPLGTIHALCDEHRKPETVESLTERPSRIVASY